MRRKVLHSAKQRENYYKAKEIVMALEPSNRSHLYMIPSNQGWYKAGGNSLLIYYFMVAKAKLNLHPTVQPDTDFTGPIFKEGIISFRGIDATEKRLKKAEVLDKIVTLDHGIVDMQYNFTCKDIEVEKFAEEMKFMQNMQLSVIRPIQPRTPKLLSKFQHIQKRVFEAARKTTIYERDYNGLLLTEYARRMIKIYMLISDGQVDDKEGWREIYWIAKKFVLEVGFLVDACVWRQDVAVAIASDIIDVMKLAERKMGEENQGRKFPVAEVD